MPCPWKPLQVFPGQLFNADIFWCLLSQTTWIVTGCVSECPDRLFNSVNIYICGQYDGFKTLSLNGNALYCILWTKLCCVLSKGWFLWNWILVLMLKIKICMKCGNTWFLNVWSKSILMNFVRSDRKMYQFNCFNKTITVISNCF